MKAIELHPGLDVHNDWYSPWLLAIDHRSFARSAVGLPTVASERRWEFRFPGTFNGMIKIFPTDVLFVVDASGLNRC
jgi:hypothetical protein